MPGGIYTDYEGPDRDLKEIAILDWSACDACSVTHVDGNDVRGPEVSWQVRIDLAHLLPGPHDITVRTYHEDLGSRSLVLQAAFEPARSYKVKQSACFECDPFEATILIEDVTMRTSVARVTATGIGAYGDIAEKRRDCEEECKAACPDSRTKKDCHNRRSSCLSLCNFFDATRRASSRKAGQPIPAFVIVKMPLQELQSEKLLAQVEIVDRRISGEPAGTLTAAFGIPMGDIAFEPPETEILKNALEIELTKLLRKRGGQSKQDFVCKLAEFRVYTDTTLFYWDVIARIRLSLVENGKAYDLSGESTIRTYLWPGEDIIKEVVDSSLKEVVAKLKAH